MAKLGYIGLGVMGGNMVARLVKEAFLEGLTGGEVIFSAEEETGKRFGGWLGHVALAVGENGHDTATA